MSEPVKAEKTGRLIKENGRYFYCDPVEITVRGYELTVRRDDAQCVQVK